MLFGGVIAFRPQGPTIFEPLPCPNLVGVLGQLLREFEDLGCQLDTGGVDGVWGIAWHFIRHLVPYPALRGDRAFHVQPVFSAALERVTV